MEPRFYLGKAYIGGDKWRDLINDYTLLLFNPYSWFFFDYYNNYLVTAKRRPILIKRIGRKVFKNPLGFVKCQLSLKSEIYRMYNRNLWVDYTKAYLKLKYKRKYPEVLTKYLSTLGNLLQTSYSKSRRREIAALISTFDD